MDPEMFDELLDVAIETAISGAKMDCKGIGKHKILIRKELSDKLKSKIQGMKDTEILDHAMGQAIEIIPSYAIKENPEFNIIKYYQGFGETKAMDLSGIYIRNREGIPTGEVYADGTTTKSFVAA